MEKTTTGKRLIEYMEKFGLKQSDICTRAGIDRAAMSNYVRDLRAPRQDVLTALAKALDVTEPWLMGYDVPMRDEPAPAQSLTPEEQTIIDAFRAMNDVGKIVVVGQFKAIAAMPEYQKDGESLEGKAT